MSDLNVMMKPQNIKTLAPHSSVLEATQIMSAEKIGSVIITENDKLYGIFTERDLVNKVSAKNKDPKQTRVADVCTKNVTTVTSDTSVEKCYELMKKIGCRHLPIIENNKVIAVVSILHVLNWTIAELELERDQLRQYIEQ